MLFQNHPIILRGGGDLATGVVYRLHQSGFPVIVLELPRPLVVRRRVAVASAVADGAVEIEGLRARRVETPVEALDLALNGEIPVLVSPELPDFPRSPTAVVDARMAKRNIDTRRHQAPLVIALGPGFTAGEDCDAVVETMRGHTLGRVYWRGSALPNTGSPGIVAGKGKERVLRAPVDGVARWEAQIGDMVQADELLGHVADRPVRAPFAGVIRGLIAEGTRVRAGLKIGDVDARGNVEACYTISDKALAIGGGVLEAVLTYLNRQT